MLPLRENACLIIVNRANKIFLAERAGVPGAWQFPQGGLGGDTVVAGAIREAHEELGVPAEYFELLHVLDVEHSYDFKITPPHYRDKWRGQHQHYVILRYLGDDSEIKLDRYEQELSEELHAYHLGEAIKEARLSRNMTQEQLGEKIGVQKSQISRLEKGRSISLSSMARIFRAMNIPLSLEIGGIGKVALW